jgi:antitoxin component YwqK of YwqJK toxin-antitoxin module
MKFNLRTMRGVLVAVGVLVIVPTPATAVRQAAAQPPRTLVELAEPPAAQPAALDPASVEPGPIAEQPTPAQPIGGEPAPVQAQVSDEGAASIDAGEVPEQLPAPDDEGEASPLDAAPVEIVKERYENGVVRIEREVTQDAAGNYIPHGLWRQYDPTGRLIAEGRYVESRKEGIWRRLYRGDDAALFATQPYRTFTPPFVSQATFKNGRLSGKWIITDAKERKVHELTFQEGERNGPSVWYYPSGQVLQTGEYVGGRAHGDFVQYGESGDSVSRESYQEGRKLAPRIDYYDGAQLVKKTEAMILHAPLVMKSADDWESATLAVFESRGQDEKHGGYTAWHKTGQIARQGEFRYDLPVGKFLYWYANGQKQLDGDYVDGRQHGDWTWWHENGLKSISGSYENGQPVGTWSWWQASGKLAQRADLSEKGIAGPQPEVEPETRQAKVRLAEPVAEMR